MPPDPQVSMQMIEETRKQINRLFEEVARLSDMDLAPADYYSELLKRVLTALAAPAGAVWVRTQQGNLQLQYQINLRQVGLDKSEEARQQHDELLRQAFQQGRPVHLPPQSSAGKPEGGGIAAGNPTDFVILLAPILVDKQVTGLIEVWQTANRHPDAIQGFIQFLVRMAEMASLYSRNHLLRQMGGQQQLWTQLEQFARQIHGSLNPIEVSYLVANEGRRLIQCDRVSVATRQGRRVKVEAISGADVVEKRSNLVQLMRRLFDTVLTWGEKLIYSGTKDDSLPPDVLHALDDYLAESNSKFLVVMPLRDERESESKKPGRSVLLMEAFETTATPEQMIARLDVVGRHSASALYNAVEHRRIPFRFLWMPLAKIQDGLGGKARAITYGVIAGVIALAAVMWFVPYPLKMDAVGQLLPQARRLVYSPVPGSVEQFLVEPGQVVRGDQELILMFDQQLQKQLIELTTEIAASNKLISQQTGRLNEPNLPPGERGQIQTEIIRNTATRDARVTERDILIGRTNAHGTSLGYYYMRAPKMPTDVQTRDASPAEWTVLNYDFREQLTGRLVKPSDPLLRLGVKEGTWEVEMKIPQKHIGQVLAAFDYTGKDELDVDLLVRSAPTRTFRGKLHKSRVSGEAKPNQSDNNESEPIVYAWVRVDGADIDPAYKIPVGLLQTAGTEVQAKVRCGDHRMGYSLFYGVYEFFYEKVVFFF